MAKSRKASLTYPRVSTRQDKEKERIWLLVTPKKGKKQSVVGSVDGPLAHTFAEIAATWFLRGFETASTT